jgi:hypothetical protein
VNYVVAFDVRNVDFMTPMYEWTGLIAVLTATVFVVARKILDVRGGKIFSWIMVCIAVFWLAWNWVSTYNLYTSAISALVDGNASVVEGRVSNFKPMPYGGHQYERFCVESRCFYYSDYASSVGFNNTSSHGGPIKADLPVRVTFVGNAILKLEIAPGANPNR